MKHTGRLRALEQTKQRAIGCRIFKQDMDDPNVYTDENEQPATMAQIDALGAAGWQCVVINYEEWRPPLRQRSLAGIVGE